MDLRRALVRLCWLSVLAFQLLAVTSCHLLFGDFEEVGGGKGGKGHTTCDKGTARCNDESLLVCNDQETMWVTSNTCASKEQCDSKSGRCLICPQAEMLRCSGAKREACSADRSAWTMKELCPSAELCSPAGCGPCQVPGQLQCSVEANGVEVIRECSQEKVWEVVTECPNDAVCMAVLTAASADPSNWDRTCKAKCTPNDFKCDGVTLYRCPQSGLDWMPVAPCATPELCEQTRQSIADDPSIGATIEQCNPGCGGAGEPRCRNGVSLERCSADQTRWEPVTECPEGTQCSTLGEGSCIVCTTGDYQCNGSVLERCSKEHVWLPEKDCLARPLCTFTNDASGGGASTGKCLEQRCARPGDNVCGSDSDPLVPGATLWECNSDLSGFTKGASCATGELCNAADKECKPPVCEAGQRRCNPEGLLEVQVCKAGRDGWERVTTCATGEFCDARDAATPCKHECPAAAFCNDKTPQACSAASGIISGAACLSKELCECALPGGNCLGGVNPSTVAGVSGCGRPVCGGNDLAGFRCTNAAATAIGGPVLQQCKPGRDGWVTASTCGAANLCVPGDPPYFKNGYCAVCPMANEIMCLGQGTSQCSLDRKTWLVKEATCNDFGCRDGGTSDYCGVCNTGETRCAGPQLLKCSDDQRSLPLQNNCAFGCVVDSGIHDYCGTCAANEVRCSGTAPGSKLQRCSADQKSLADIPNMVCANGCIITAGTAADYCSDCRVGATQCSGAGVRTCGDDGHWGAPKSCDSGCVTTSTGTDYCGGCAKDELRCSGSTLQECSADQKTLKPKADCAPYACIDSDLEDYCAVCGDGERRCSDSNLQQCSDDRKSLTTVEMCGYGCINSNDKDFCAACSEGELRCAGSEPGSKLQVCVADRTRLMDSSTCANGCFQNGTTDYCGDCRPGQSRCTDDGKLQTCGDNGRWGTASACSNGCFGPALAAYCGECEPTATKCEGSALHTCDASGRWAVTTPICANGCFGEAPGAFCGVCPMGGAECVDGTSRRTCVSGQWSAATACPDSACVGNSCVECTPTSTSCVDSSHVQVCSAAGSWGASMACPNDACFNDKCVDCMPQSTECMSSSSRRVCSDTGTWGPAMTCASMACVGNDCAACIPGVKECVGTTGVRTCSDTGAWSATTTCADGCINSGTADYCADCSPDEAECVDSTTRRECGTNGRWTAAAECAAPNPACLAGVCVACSPGSTMCMEEMQVTCGTNGSWGDPESCPTGMACTGTACAAP